jgi:hypothetical protein
MSEPKPVDHKVAKALFSAGNIMGMIDTGKDPAAIKLAVQEIDIGVLQSYLDTKPEGFHYTKQCEEVIRLARTIKSFSKGIEPSEPPGQGQ